MTSYDTSFRIQCEKLKEVGSPLEGTAKAWWYLQKAYINDEIRQKAVTAAGGVYEYTKLRQALVAIIPDVNKLPNEVNVSPSTGNSANHPRKWQTRKQYRVNAVAEGEAEGEEDALSDASEMEREAEVLMTQAAKKRAELEKARGFSSSKTPSKETPEERAKRIEGLKQRLPCSACKSAGVLAYGHWHQDASCPQKKATSGAFVVDNKAEEESEEDEMEQAFQVEVTRSKDGAVVMFANEGMREEDGASTLRHMLRPQRSREAVDASSLVPFERSWNPFLLHERERAFSIWSRSKSFFVMGCVLSDDDRGNQQAGVGQMQPG